MPYYQNLDFFKQIKHQNFDYALNPGQPALDAGIYRCAGCGHEIGIAHGHTLPPQNHHQHTDQSVPVRWHLVAAAIQRFSP